MKEIVKSMNDAYRFVDRYCTTHGREFNKLHTIEIKEYRKPRTLPQNAKCNAMIRELAKEIGYSFDDLKYWLKAEHGPIREVIINGVVREVPVSTTKYTAEQMTDMIGHIERIGAEMGFRFSHESEEVR